MTEMRASGFVEEKAKIIEEAFIIPPKSTIICIHFEAKYRKLIDAQQRTCRIQTEGPCFSLQSQW